MPLELAERVASHRLDAELRKKRDVSVCMAGNGAFGIECSKKIISSHTISRSSALRRIARDGHVCAVNVSFSSLNRSGGRIQPELQGINRTSTFNGFCSSHDDQIFKLIDAMSPEIGADFCARMAFRSICKELYLKKHLQSSPEHISLMQSGRSNSEQLFIHEFYGGLNRGMQAAVRDLTAYKSSLENAISAGDVASWSHSVVLATGEMPIALSSLFQPEQDLDGRQLQNIGDLESGTQGIIFSALPFDGGGCFIISHRTCDDIAMRFLASVNSISDQNILSYLVGLAFEMSENIAISPAWWDGLDNLVKERLLDAMNRGVSPFHEPSSELRPLATNIDLPLKVAERYYAR